MKLIIGLGNPTKKHRNNRHNVGYLFLDQLIKKLGLDAKWENNKKFKADIVTTTINKQDIILAKPNNFMNLSGFSVSKLMNYYHLNNIDLLVIYDDIDLDLGTYRIRKMGSSGGHKGMQSIINLVGEHFARLRVGINSPEKSIKKDTANYVLANFTSSEQKIINNVIKSGLVKVSQFIDDEPVKNVTYKIDKDK